MLLLCHGARSWHILSSVNKIKFRLRKNIAWQWARWVPWKCNLALKEGLCWKKFFFPKISKAGTFATELDHFTDLEKDCVSRELPPADKQRWGSKEKASSTQPSQANGRQSKARQGQRKHIVACCEFCHVHDLNTFGITKLPSVR